MRFDALWEHLEFLSELGYKGLLVEYEDLFPYRSVDVALHREEVWTPAQLNAFQVKARSLGLEIIPLQQSLGHLEYAFRWKRYRPFSLSTGYPSTLDITSEEAREWLLGMLREILEAHPDSGHIHLGMDEAYALIHYAARHGQNPLTLFLDYLESLCALCETYGKWPWIWADMLERHLDPEQIERIRALRNRLGLVSWNYHGPWKGKLDIHTTVHFAGMRTASCWWTDARQEGAPEALNDTCLALEDWPQEIADLAAPYRIDDKHVKTFFPSAVWKDMGFKVMGGCGIATAQDGAVLPASHRRMSNVDTWVGLCREQNLDALVVTCWARGDTFRAPHVLPHAVFPLYEYAAAKMGETTFTRYAGIPRERLWNLLWKMGRCQQDGWYIHQSVLAEMKDLSQQLSAGRREWELLELLFRISEIRSRGEMLLGDCEKRFFADRLIASEWEKRLIQLEECVRTLENLREEARVFEEDYHGHALQEWFVVVFDALLKKLRQTRQGVLDKKNRALQIYET